MKKIITVIIFSLGAFLLVISVTQRYGLGVYPDSLAYIEVSRNFQKGAGVVNNKGVLVNHWPPLYPIMLSLSSDLMGLDILESGRYLNAILVSILFILFNLILNKYKPSILLSILLNTLLLFSWPVIGLFSAFCSEVLFMVLFLVVIYTYFQWVETNQKHLIFLAGILSGLMILTRYAGIGFLGGMFIFIFFFPKEKLKNRITNLCIFAAPFLLIFSTWYLYAHSLNSDVHDREFVFHPITISKIKNMLVTFSNWILPSQTKLTIIALFSLTIGMLAAQPSELLFYKFDRLKGIILNIYSQNKEVSFLLSLLVFSYILFLFASISLFDAHTPLDNTILAPLFPLFVLLLAPFLSELIKRHVLKRFFLLSLTVILFNMGYSFCNNYIRIYSNGDGYTRKIWVQSETIKELKTTSVYKIYTNGPDVVKFYLPNYTAGIYFLPRWIWPETQKENEFFELNFDKMEKSIKSGESVLCYLDNITWRYYLPKKETILEKFKNFDILKFDDGFIIQKPTPHKK